MLPKTCWGLLSRSPNSVQQYCVCGFQSQWLPTLLRTSRVTAEILRSLCKRTGTVAPMELTWAWSSGTPHAPALCIQNHQPMHTSDLHPAQYLNFCGSLSSGLLDLISESSQSTVLGPSEAIMLMATVRTAMEHPA